MEKSKVNNVISKTLLFIIMMIYVVLFEKIFGEDNVKIGITILITTLMLLTEDLTQNSFKNFVILLFINLVTGLAAYLAANNLYAAIILNFLILSLIGYFFSYKMTKGLILPFGLQYLFMLYGPVYGDSLKKRWFSLIAGACIVMVSQFIFHAKKRINDNSISSVINIKGRRSNNIYKNVDIFGFAVKIHTVRASYAIRIGILTAFTAFLVQYFHLAEGRWMVYTIFSVTELYSENTKIKAVKRLQGTIIGALVLLAFFYFVRSSALRGLSILVVGFLNSFVSDYRDQMILTTISAVTPVALVAGSKYAVFERLLYVFIGIIIALIANKIILSKSKEDYA